MADFHRLSAPTYFGGLPATYDYLNDPSDPSVGGSGVPALVDAIKSGGTNDGTYFVAFNEDGRSNAVNRGLAALGLNTDYLDDILRSSIPKITSTDTTAVGAVSTIALTGEIFVGDFGLANNAVNRNQLVHVTDQASEDDLEVGGTKIVVTLIHDGASANVVGTETDGFRTNASVNLSPSIPNGTAYRIWYGVRSSLTEIAATEKGTYFRNIMRSVEHVPGALRGRLRELHSEASVNQAYLDPWDSTIRSLASAGLNERYRRSTTQPVGFVTGDYNVAGGGRVILRDGGAVEVRSAAIDLTAVQYPDPQLAGIRTVPNVTRGVIASFTGTKGGDIGFIHESEHVARSFTAEAVRDSFSGPGFLEVLPRDIRAGTVGGDNVITFINPTANGSLNPDSINSTANRRTIECAAGQYFRLSGQTGIRPQVDLLEVTYSGRAPETYVVDEITTDTRVRVYRLNGDDTNIFPATATACTIRWLQVLWFVGGSARSTASDAPWGSVRFAYFSPAPLTDDPGNEFHPRPAGFYAALSTEGIDENAFTALAWGHVDVSEMSGGLNQLGKLYGDGSLECTIANVTNDLFVGDDVVVGSTVQAVNLSSSAVASLTNVTISGSITSPLDVNGAVTLDSTLGVAGAVILGSTLDAVGAITTDDILIAGTGVTTLTGDINAADDLLAGDDIFAGNDIFFGGSLKVDAADIGSVIIPAGGGTTLNPGTKSVWFLEFDFGANLAGIVAPADGTARIIWLIHHINNASAVSILNEDLGATAANRFMNGTDYVFPVGRGVAAMYNPLASRWVVFG